MTGALPTKAADKIADYQSAIRPIANRRYSSADW